MSNYEQSILDTNSTPRLRRAVLDKPPEPEVPWHIYPVPTHMMTAGVIGWQWYKPGAPYIALKYSDGNMWHKPPSTLALPLLPDGPTLSGGERVLTHPPES